MDGIFRKDCRDSGGIGLRVLNFVLPVAGEDHLGFSQEIGWVAGQS
jgi:hypothetical protein